MLVGPKQVLIGSYPRPACGDVFVQGLQKTQSHGGVEVRQNFFPIWTRWRIGGAGDRMRKPGLRRECPTPPAAPNERGEKSMQGGRQLRRWQINTQVAVEVFTLPRNDHAAAKTETNLFVAKAQNPKVTEATDRAAIDNCAQGLSRVVDDSNLLAASKIDNRVDVRRIAKKVRHH